MKRNPTIWLCVFLLLACAALTACAANTPVALPPSAGSTQAASPTAAQTGTVAPATAEPAATASPAPVEPLRYTNPQRYSVRYTVTIGNTGFSPSDVRLYLPMPAEWDAQKDLETTQLSPEPQSQAAEETSGNAMLYWQWKDAPEQGASAAIEVCFTLTAYETNTGIDPSAVLPYREGSPEVERYTGAEKYIEADDPEIIALADTLANGEPNPYLAAKVFYDHIVDTAEYELLGQGLNGANYLLDNGCGECGDYSALFIALCRATGIPARPVVGFWAATGKNQTHVWAEFYLEGIGWVPVDATIGQQNLANRSYYFGNMDNQRIILGKGYNTKLVPEGPDQFAAPILQVPLWWYWGSGDAGKFNMEWAWSVEKLS